MAFPSVIHAVHSLDVGGLERIVVSLLCESRRLGQRVSVVCLEQPGTLADEAEAMGVAVRCVGKPQGLKLETIRKLHEVFAEFRPDVVHTHQIAALFYGGPAARRAGVPVVVHTEHGKHQYRGRTRLMAWWAARYARRFFCVSSDIAAMTVARRIAPIAKVRVIPNGINVARFAEGGDLHELRRSLGVPADAPVIGTVGRLDEIKRQDLLIRGFARLGAADRLPHLLLVGDGPMRDSLQGLVRELGLDQRVHFAGYQDNPTRFLHAMDIFALTSRSEGMPLSVLEAWAAGLPVITSRVGGLPELIEERRTGLMFNSGDEAGFVRCVEELLENPGAARQLGDAGRERVRARFDVSVMSQNYQQHYLELLTRTSGEQAAVTGRSMPAPAPAGTP